MGVLQKIAGIIPRRLNRVEITHTGRVRRRSLDPEIATGVVHRLHRTTSGHHESEEKRAAGHEHPHTPIGSRRDPIDVWNAATMTRSSFPAAGGEFGYHGIER
jgi:hypothetical protein